MFHDNDRTELGYNLFASLAPLNKITFDSSFTSNLIDSTSRLNSEDATDFHTATTVQPSTEDPIISMSRMFHYRNNGSHICWTQVKTGRFLCRLKCPHGYFSLPNMTRCRKWLDCSNFDEIIIDDEFCNKNSSMRCKHHYVKQIFLANWGGHTVVLANSTEGWHGLGDKWDRVAKYLFRKGMKHLQLLQGNHSFVPQYLGGCPDKWYITEWYSNGGLADFESLLLAPETSFMSKTAFRFHLCISYARVLHFLKHSPNGPSFNADSDTLVRTMSQFILSDNLNVILVDVDMLPEAKNGTLCRSKALYPFVAPEQVCEGPTNETPKDSELAKTDIWKFPSVCRKILAKRHRRYPLLHDGLTKIFELCLKINPAERPDIDQLLAELEQLSLKSYRTVL